MSESSLPKKLKMRPGIRIAVLDAPAVARDQLGDLPDGASVTTDLSKDVDFILLFAQDSAAMRRRLPAVLKMLREDTSFWIAYPKGSSGLQTDLTRDEGWQPVEDAGMRAVALVSMDETWSVIRFRLGARQVQGDPVEAQYAGNKAGLRPIYDRLVEVAMSFGSDVELAPRQTYVGLVRKKIFTLIQPSTASRVDLGLKLKGLKGGDRLAEAPGFGSGSITHKVALMKTDDVDEEVIGWMRQAYDEAK